MATPNDPNPPKKPTPPGQPPAAPGKPVQGKPIVPPSAKPPVPGAARPAQPAQPGARPAVPVPGKPAQPGAGQPGQKPVAKAPAKPGAPVKKPEKAPKSTGGGRTIEQVLVDLGFLDESQQWDLRDEAKANASTVADVALSRGIITHDQLLQGQAELFGLKVVNLQEVKPTPEAITALPENMATAYKALPLSYKDGVLTVAVGDPANIAGLDDLRNLQGFKEVVPMLAVPAHVTDGLAKTYAGKEESIIDLIAAMEEDTGLKPKHRETSIDLDSLIEQADAAPVRKLLNMVMLMGIKDHASDIHFEPFEDEYKMRYRCDGVLYEMVPPPRHLAMAIASRIKVMANLDIAERRMPQDGRIELNVGGNQVDMRVSILPTMFGESAVIRILDRSNVGLDLNKIGMPQSILGPFREMIQKPNGIVLVTGPTGSGKTTTLYSALNSLNDVQVKIITTEDPIEYDIDGIVQCPINADIGVTFAAALRAILRQDPDIILVGEIRDLETAQIAVQSALTGHIVFSTLHTNDAPSTITRLRDMGLEPFLITATVEGILAQRLVRKICTECRTEFEPSAEILMELNLKPEDAKGKKFYYGKGCDRCNNTGYKGRTGIHELVVMNDELRDLISAGTSTDQLRLASRRLGMVTLRENGLAAIYNGVTTIDEVVHETVLEDEV